MSLGWLGSPPQDKARPGKEVNQMDLKLWSPLLDLDREWRFDFPKIVREAGEFRPSIDLAMTDGQLVLTAELPGMKADDLEVSIENDILTVKGEKTEEKETSEEDRYVHERSYGAFQRRVALPDGVSEDAVKAVYDNGILTVKVDLPEAKAKEPLRIPVGAKS